MFLTHMHIDLLAAVIVISLSCFTGLKMNHIHCFVLQSRHIVPFLFAHFLLIAIFFPMNGCAYSKLISRHLSNDAIQLYAYLIYCFN